MLDRLLVWLMPRLARGAPGWRDLINGRYLSALAALRREYVSAEQTPLACDFLRWALNAVDPWGSAWELTKKGILRPHAADIVEPESLLREAMQRHRVVVLMERHHAPETRLFGARALGWLAAAGATHLAFEHGWQASLSEFERSGIVRPSTESYAFEPSRAAILRAARSLGLRLVAFDVMVPSGVRGLDAATRNRERERGMARNIADRILDRYPEARVVVWTGEQHAMRHTPSGWPVDYRPYMASHLADLSGEEPFCVGQELVQWPQLSGKPGILVADHPWLLERGLDAMVLHHRGAEPQRPGWLDVDSAPCPIQADGAELVQAIAPAEGERSVPVSQVLTHGSQEVRLQLAAGDYLLRGLRD